MPLSSQGSYFYGNQTTVSPNAENQNQSQTQMNLKQFPQNSNYHSINNTTINQNQNGFLPQQNQMRQMSLNSLNFNMMGSNNAYMKPFILNNSNNTPSYYILAQMNNPMQMQGIPLNYNNAILIQNPQTQSQNQVLVPIMKTQNVGYVLVENPNQIGNNCLNMPNFLQFPNNNMNNMNNNQNLYFGSLNGKGYFQNFQNGGN